MPVIVLKASAASVFTGYIKVDLTLPREPDHEAQHDRQLVEDLPLHRL